MRYRRHEGSMLSLTTELVIACENFAARPKWSVAAARSCPQQPQGRKAQNSRLRGDFRQHRATLASWFLAQ